MNKKNSFFAPIISLFLISCIVTGAVAAVNAKTETTIREMENEKEQLAMQTVLPDATAFDYPDVTEMGMNDSVVSFSVGYKNDGSVVGYCIKSVTSGFSDKITLMVGITQEKTINGVSIVDASGETPGLGSRVTEPSFCEQFVGKGINIEFVKINAKQTNQVSAISGATYSSKGVYEGVLSALEAVVIYEQYDHTEGETEE